MKVDYTAEPAPKIPLRVRTGAHGRSLDVLTKDIPITSSSLFGGDPGKAVAKAATASRNYKAL